MKKINSKNTIIIVLFVLLLLTICISFISLRKTVINERNAKELEKELSFVSVRVTSDEKKTFSDEKELQYLKEKENGQISKITDGNNEDFIANEILKSMPDEEVKTLEKYGIYKLNTTTNNKKIEEDIELSTPHVFYNAVNQTWIVATWGRWITNNWNHAIVSQDLGDKCQFCVYHSEIDGPYNTHLTNSIGYITDDVNEKSKYTTSRSGGVVDDRAVGEGFYFEMQDYTYGLFQKKYVGEKWYGSCTFDASYEEFGGEVTSHYRP